MDIIAAFVNCGTPCILRDSDDARADDVNGRRQRALTFRVAWAEGARPFERSRDGATIIPVANIASSQSNKAVAFQIPCSIGCFVSACSLSAHTGVGARSCKALVSTDVGLAQCEAYVIHFNVWVRSCHFDEPAVDEPSPARLWCRSGPLRLPHASARRRPEKF